MYVFMMVTLNRKKTTYLYNLCDLILLLHVIAMELIPTVLFTYVLVIYNILWVGLYVPSPPSHLVWHAIPSWFE